METAQRIQAVKDRLEMLNDLAAKLSDTIKIEKTKKYFLDPIRNTLANVETELLPWALRASTPSNASMFLDGAEFELGQVEGRLNYVQKIVATYGPDIQLIGDE